MSCCCLCLAVGLGGGSGFQVFLSFYFFFFFFHFSSFLVGPAGGGRGSRGAVLGLLCGSKVGGERSPRPHGLILPTGERRESTELPGCSFASLKEIHIYGCLRRFFHSKVGFGRLKYFGKFSCLQKKKSWGGFSSSPPSPPVVWKHGSALGCGWQVVRGGSVGMLTPQRVPPPRGRPGFVPSLHRSSRNDPAAPPASPAASGTGNFKFPVPTPWISSSSVRPRGLHGAGGTSQTLQGDGPVLGENKTANALGNASSSSEDVTLLCARVLGTQMHLRGALLRLLA